MGKNPLCKLSCWLVIIGAINWGLVGLGDFTGGNYNVVELLLGAWPQVESVVYVLVGLSGVGALVKKCSGCKSC